MWCFEVCPAVQIPGLQSVTKNQLFVERRSPVDYAVKRPGAARASDLLRTQAEAIDRGQELNPRPLPLVEVVRHTDRQRSDEWHKPSMPPLFDRHANLVGFAHVV